MIDDDCLWNGYPHPDWWDEGWQKSYPDPELRVWIEYDQRRFVYMWEDGFYLRPPAEMGIRYFQDFELHEALCDAYREGYILMEEIAFSKEHLDSL